MWFGETVVIASAHDVRVQSSCLGVSHTRCVQRGEIAGFEIAPATQKGREVWYDVALRLPDGRKTNSGTGMEKTEAEWFVGELRKELGVRVPDEG